MTEEAVVLPTVAKKPKKIKPAAEGEAVVTKPEKDVRNGVFRPLGALTGKVWDVADAVSAEQGRPALRKEVWQRYKSEVGENAMESTSNTQYFKWVKWHGHSKAIREIRSGESNTPLPATEAQPAA